MTQSLSLSEHLKPPKLANESAFREAFTTLLENPEFLADGGGLAFGLTHVYPIDKSIKHVHTVLKGSDAVVYQNVRALGYEPVLYVYYEYSEEQGMIIDEVIIFENVCGHQTDTFEIIHREGGIFVTRGSGVTELDEQFGMPERVAWVTPMTELNRQEEQYEVRNERRLELVYGDVCLVVRIGKAGDRLAYPTVAEVNKAYEKSGRGC